MHLQQLKYCDAMQHMMSKQQIIQTRRNQAVHRFQGVTIPSGGSSGGCNETMDIKCKGSGDPHFTTWDNSRHHFQGVGYYDYVTKCNDDVFFPFTITAKQEECGIYAPMTCIREVRVTLSDGRIIIFPRNGAIRVCFCFCLAFCFWQNEIKLIHCVRNCSFFGIILMLGCLHSIYCTDFRRCQQCADRYSMVERLMW